MNAKIMDGSALARELRADCKIRAAGLTEKGMQPGLAVVIAGDNPASRIYVRNKAKACSDTGIYSEIHEFSENASQDEVIERIQELNRNSRIHGILVQLPLPRRFESDKVIASVAVEKDVDGFHLYNVGSLVTGNAIFPPCTPHGVIKILEKYSVPIEGQHAVVVGRSNIVGKPMALMLLQRGATVTICTSKTRDLAEHTHRADILVVATGKPHMITASMVKDGAAVIDVGINRMPDGKLAGDVEFESVKEKAGYITPVPGGVGPVTIAMLLYNTIEAAERAYARA
ncbi:methenyltetrahydrofolate cyclohydrolase /5,10-methylenetetrahydrofolate dehydrogenase (NADP+) [Nitrosospira sp. Nsp11]|uniref:bifunctional methylenetetrahydrofolate dehydrogenase/methenyltetrahydrofolate cyclohydrolase FolD n=1 Tax=Nitrosospira sp. Nsp11 TaxID=1855338 RepID=UPI00090F01B0|nr:bifunctional methylenetetrahydrofolate dehydrogenase/methenyltetrahydrofolate cyclohydrolase FolD [Nitrosospira sp. Nsp11]SHM07689.1 methenyltetrahydrofolate cyclohydrolase /5,10-methylenetetrahydrofolate dehydrogenase (NADP+) [Nitrosospira sp. Nsp11]